VPSKKEMLAAAWSRSGLARASLRFRPAPENSLLVLAYHRILDLGDEDRFIGDPELVSASTADFEWQMRFVARHFRPTTFGRVLDLEAAGLPLPPRSLIVTFDDGHADNYVNAFPILRATGVPATIFLSTDYIESESPFWFDLVARIFSVAPAGAFQLDAVPLAGTLSDVRSRRAATGQLLARLKRVSNAQRLACLAELQSRLQAPRSAIAADGPFAVAWTQVREMAASGIEFGSHTVSHPILTQLTHEELERELRDSREIIRRETGQPVDVIAYPIGKHFAFDERVKTACRDCGYRLGVSYETGVAEWPSKEQFALRRLAIERYTSRAMFESLLSLPRVFA